VYSLEICQLSSSEILTEIEFAPEIFIEIEFAYVLWISTLYSVFFFRKKLTHLFLSK
jgi:hypothetical protein